MADLLLSARVAANASGQAVISWELVPQGAVKHVPTCKVLRSPKGDTWTEIFSSTSAFYYTDADTDIRNYGNAALFKVQVTRGSSSETSDILRLSATGPEQVTPAWVAALQSVSTTYKVAGAAGWLHRKKKTGTQCTACTDPVTGAPTGEACSTCYGTGIVGGYYEPAGFYVGIEAPKEATDTNRSVAADDDKELTRIAIPDIIPIDDGDLWRFQASGELWRLRKLVHSSMLGYPFIAKAVLTKIKKDAPEQALSVPSGDFESLI